MNKTPNCHKQSSRHQRLVRLGKYAAVIYWAIGVLDQTQSYMVSIAIAALGCVIIAEGELNDARSRVTDALSERLDIALKSPHRLD